MQMSKYILNEFIRQKNKIGLKLNHHPLIDSNVQDIVD